jgi:hypothetical protein
LHIDGMATVVNDVQPVADPANPNRRRANRAFAQIDAGTNVYLVDKFERRNVDYWQVYLGGDAPQLAWVPQPVDGEPNLEEFHPQCPTDFPLTAELLARMSGSEALTCFGNSELTLSGALHCDRAIADGLVGGPILESNRSCTLDDHYRILGEAVTSLLEDPPVESIDGQYLIRGHFDDPGAQHCGPVSFGSPLGQAGGPPAPGTIMFCRILFVASNAIARD